MTKSRKPADERRLRLRAEARLHDGVIPVPFLDQTWRTRGAAYWRRRVGAVILMVLLLALVGGMAVAFTIGIVGDGDDAVRIVLAVLYALTAVAGVRTGRRPHMPPQNRRRPAGRSSRRPGHVLPERPARLRAGTLRRRPRAHHPAGHVRPRLHR
jgi:hypothetical protein